MGDLNELSNHDEKLFAYEENSTRYTMFNKIINTNGLIDIGHLGIPFTWYSNREATNAIFARLDQELTNVHWLNNALLLTLTIFQLSGQIIHQSF